MTTEQSSKQLISSSLVGLPSIPPGPFAFGASLPPLDGSMASWQAYLLDAWQRSVLFLDVLRQRGNEQEAITARPAATVLRFAHEPLMSGRSLPRPINYSLSRIIPPPHVALDPRKRPVVVVDPRAGQGPGIGGFKVQSEIGDALEAGHPVYFINFSAEPEPGQQFLDVVEGQVKFFERVAERHPDAPRPFAVGNCQAGYQTLMVAMLRPDLFGPCLVAGSPMSYWQGVHGKTPMRYSGGLLGGSWLTALTNDLGNGTFDGTWLILNFDDLNPANWLWGKQYDVYAAVDTEAKRYLEFEKWWGDFIDLNGDEIQFLVDELFIGDKLTRNQLQSHDGKVFDLRNITSPIIVFTSLGDNISPPPQTLGWILDLYRDVDDIRSTGRTIVYCLNQRVGHLAIFVSSKVGAKEDEEFIQLMDVIDTLPPGLYELVIEPKPADAALGGFITGDWICRFELRTLDDIRALGRNSVADDRAFATVARVSEINHSIYRTFFQPFVRAFANQPAADLWHQMNPLRLSYTLFADKNPLMKGVESLAAEIAAARRPVETSNPYWQIQELVSRQMTAALDGFRNARDQMVEQTFFAIYGSPIVQALVGLRATDDPIRQLPSTSPERIAERQARAEAYAEKLNVGGFDEALVRAAIYVVSAERAVDARCALAMNAVRQQMMHLSLDSFKTLVRDQFFVYVLERERAIEALGTLIPTAEQRQELLAQVTAIVGAAGSLTPAERERWDRLETVLGKALNTRVSTTSMVRAIL
jgi:hypothetical protein